MSMLADGSLDFYHEFKPNISQTRFFSTFETECANLQLEQVARKIVQIDTDLEYFYFRCEPLDDKRYMFCHQKEDEFFECNIRSHLDFDVCKSLNCTETVEKKDKFEYLHHRRISNHF